MIQGFMILSNVTPFSIKHNNNSTQPTCFPNHMAMTQGNTCMYIHDLTNNNNSGDSISSSG